jgi:hypothetical protein
MEMKEKIFVLLIIFLILALHACKFNSEVEESQAKETSTYSEIDLSTPKRTIFYFFEAFRIGKDDLLNEVLAPGALIPEFNPWQKILGPAPYILGADIYKIQPVSERKEYAKRKEFPDVPSFFIEPSDVEVYVNVRIDSDLLQKALEKSEYRAMLGGRMVFLLRKIDNKWKIISAIPFWPEDFLNDSK